MTTTFDEYDDYNNTEHYDYNYTLTLDPDDIFVDNTVTADGVVCPEHKQGDMDHIVAISYWIRDNDLSLPPQNSPFCHPPPVL